MTVIAGLLTIAAIVCMLIAWEISEWDARVQVKQFEQTFGFTTGLVQVPDGQGGNVEVWGIASVTAGGKFDRTGVRAGDVPFDYHGHGAASLLNAVRLASAGEPGSFDVANATDWMAANSLRRIEIAPHRREP